MLQETCLLWTQAGWSKSEPLPGPYTTLRANRTSPPGGHRGLAAHLSLQLCRHLPKGTLDCGSQYTWSGGHSGERSVVASAPRGTHSTWQLCRHGQNHRPTERGRGHKASPAEVRGFPSFQNSQNSGSQKQGRCRSSPGKTKTSHTCVTFLRKSSGSPEGPVLVTLRAETHGHPGTCSAPSPSGDLTPRVAVREILLGSRLNSQGLRGVPLLTPDRSLLLQRAMSTARLEGGSQVPEHQAEGGEEPVR